MCGCRWGGHESHLESGLGNIIASITVMPNPISELAMRQTDPNPNHNLNPNPNPNHSHRDFSDMASCAISVNVAVLSALMLVLV